MKQDTSVGRYMGMIARCARMHLVDVLEPLGVSEPAFPLLMMLYDGDDLFQDDMVRIHPKDKANVARALFRLEEDGFIYRQTATHDRRKKRVKLTPKARRLESQVRRLIEKWEDTVFLGFTQKERETAVRFLQRMAQNARHAVEGA